MRLLQDVKFLQSPGYRAPETTKWNALSSMMREQRNDSFTLWSAIDVWSLGCVAMEMLSGQKLFPVKQGGVEPTICSSCQVNCGVIDYLQGKRLG